MFGRPSRRYVKAARKELKTKLPPNEIESVLAQAKRNYRELAPCLPKEKTLGAKTFLRMSCYSIALYRALIAADVSEQEATRLTSEAIWRVSMSMASPAFWLADRLFKDRYLRIRWLGSAGRLFVFKRPAWIIQDVEREDGFGFDITRCPLAEYFESEGLLELCVEAFCAGDFRPEFLGGAKLTRTGTIAGGARRCDFRYSR